MFGNTGIALSDSSHSFKSLLPRRDILHQSPKPQVEKANALFQRLVSCPLMTKFSPTTAGSWEPNKPRTHICPSECDKWVDQMELHILMLQFSNTTNSIRYYCTMIPCDKHHGIPLNKEWEFYPIWTRWGWRWTSTNLLTKSSLDNHLDSLKKSKQQKILKMKSLKLIWLIIRVNILWMQG